MALVRASLCSTRETPPVSIPPRKHAVDSLNVSANITAAGKAINDPVSESDAQAARVASEKSRTVPAAPNTTVSARQVEKSQSSFGAFNKLLHGFTASKTPKGTVKKGSNLTDAQVGILACLKYATVWFALPVAFCVSAVHCAKVQCCCQQPLCLVQIAKIRYKSKDNFAGSALHILHRGINYIVYIATAKETGLKLLLKVYDLSELPLIGCSHIMLYLTWLQCFLVFLHCCCNPSTCESTLLSNHQHVLLMLADLSTG